jgi:pycsar effector protein
LRARPGLCSVGAVEPEELTEEERLVTLSPLERHPRREPQTYQELSPQIDFLYRAVDSFAQWVQFADAKSGGVVLVLSIGALDIFNKAREFINAHHLAHPAWGWISLAAFILAIGGMAMTMIGVARTLFPKILPSKPSDYFFTVAGSYPDSDAYAASVTSKRERDLIDHVAIQAWSLARIADDKYRHLRHAYAGAFVFLITWGVARITLSLAS